ncbi:hypothetical protein, partial [Kingella kingae]|uniref:hypothetical protein n=1 Tax=Kingella kingae TaxID=504 RepID=UPI002556894A
EINSKWVYLAKCGENFARSIMLRCFAHRLIRVHLFALAVVALHHFSHRQQVAINQLKFPDNS